MVVVSAKCFGADTVSEVAKQVNRVQNKVGVYFLQDRAT